MPEEGDEFGRGLEVPSSIMLSTNRVNDSNQQERYNSQGHSEHAHAPKQIAGRVSQPLTPPLSEDLDKSRYQRHVRSASSPIAPFSPMSFYHVGIGSASPLTPLRRQFSSPLFRTSRRRPQQGVRFTDENVDTDQDADNQHRSSEDDRNESISEDDEETENDDEIPRNPSVANETPSKDTSNIEFIQESKDALINRLNDIIQRISSLPDEDGLGNDNHESLGELHLKVYEMEKILPPSSYINPTSGNTQTSRWSKRPKPLPLQRRTTTPTESTRDTHPPSVPNWLGSRFPGVLLASPPLFPHPPPEETTKATDPTTPKDSTNKTPSHLTNAPRTIHPPPSPTTLTQIATQAESLTTQLASTLQALHLRREESTHLHSLLVERAEAAALKILSLEQDILHLQEDLDDNEYELKHLRLRVHAVETLCSESVTPHVEAVDPELIRAIETWKSDWAVLREKMMLKKKARGGGKGEDVGLRVLSSPASTAGVGALVITRGIMTPVRNRGG